MNKFPDNGTRTIPHSELSAPLLYESIVIVRFFFFVKFLFFFSFPLSFFLVELSAARGNYSFFLLYSHLFFSYNIHDCDSIIGN